MCGILNYAKKCQYLKRNTYRKFNLLVDILNHKLYKKTALFATT
ncbi:hypothetical protein Cal7507_0523 [Calothrix sp. PCC 7507]|nr:hypothetical protein Cal7507_0523 [Calothrix sp. PCC 7507]